jgi:hypothetical protein
MNKIYANKKGFFCNNATVKRDKNSSLYEMYLSFMRLDKVILSQKNKVDCSEIF